MPLLLTGQCRHQQGEQQEGSRAGACGWGRRVVDMLRGSSWTLDYERHARSGGLSGVGWTSDKDPPEEATSWPRGTMAR